MKSLAILYMASLLANAQDAEFKDYWYSGAEISSYTLEQARYGQSYPGHAELIFVTEPFLIDKQVKNESNKSNSTSVLKLNRLTAFNTGIYSYRTMTSVFRPIDLGEFPYTLKTTTSLQDWCGQTFQQANFRDHSWQIQLNSYFENPGDQKLTLPKAYNEEGLWVTLRLDPKKLPVGEINVLPSARYARFNHKKVAIAKAEAALEQGGATSTYSLHFPELKRTLTIHFDSSFPYGIQSWADESPAGKTKATLKRRLAKSAYWNLSKPSDSDKRKLLGLDPVAN